MNNETLESGLAPFFKRYGKKEDWMVHAVNRLIYAIEKKDSEHLRALIGNIDNKASREAFCLITKIKLPKTKSGSLLAIDSFCGVSEEGRREIEDTHKKKLEDKTKKSELMCAFRGIALTYFSQNLERALEHWKKLSKEFCRIEYIRNRYALIDATDENLFVTELRTKYGLAKTWNAFLKACIYFGGLDQSLEIIEGEL